MFDVTADPVRNLLKIRLFGFLSAADAHAYMDAIERALNMLARFSANGNPNHLSLLDARDAPLQSQEVIAIFTERQRNIASARRHAVVTGQSLFRMQMRRLTKSNMQSFETLAEAERWLFSDSPAESGDHRSVAHGGRA